MPETDDIEVVLYSLDLTMNYSDNITHQVRIRNHTTLYTMVEYDAQNIIVSRCELSKDGKIRSSDIPDTINTVEELRANKIMSKAYDIIFNYYLITNIVKNPDVILENTADKFIIKNLSGITGDYGDPYNISLAPNNL